MKGQDKYFNSKRIHFVGIGGVSMSALALYSLSMGACVSGSDAVYSSVIENLREKGATVYIGHKSENVVMADMVVSSSAILDDNPEIVNAKRLKIPIVKRSVFLGEILADYPKVITVCGSHGKTTATAMLAQILIESGLDPTVFLGGEYSEYKNFRLGAKNYAVAEVCEYKKNILDVKGDISVVLNLDNDHMDCYKDMNDLTETFNSATKSGVRIINADDICSVKLGGLSTLTFGKDKPANYKAERVKKCGEGYSFTVYAYSRRQIRIKLKVGGEHNVYNALSAYAVADYLNISVKHIKRALEKFSGVKRRNELLGHVNGIRIVADYAHHPKEISATIKMHKEIGEPFAVIFQPHTYSRTKLLMKDFLKAFEGAFELAIYKTYPAREIFCEEGSAKTLSERLKGVGKGNFYLEDISLLKEWILGLTGKVDKVLVLGAGDLYFDVMGLLDKDKK